ncbi:hypothetical protein [Streptomyces cellostaticus]|uniref:hypothetical protein n=1 Tax=Streptomyces cellostaticus TaxID=67285 RepID=UPI00082B4E29|nr:hypothetical protein [Streptomyces cellostaticus]GHI03817.1 hypothetical protein Scel_21380 [Streptomyces cellostaticus]
MAAAHGGSAAPPAPSACGVAAPSPGSRAAPPPQESPEVPHERDLRHGDPLHDLVHTAVADRPLEDVVRLIALLEGSPEHTRTMSDALRAVGVGRSVEDVTRLVALLTRPPRDSGSADEVIRAAAEGRSLEDVVQLMELLHRTSVEPHCARAVVEAAAVHRPVEELAELIARLAAVRTGRETRPPDMATSGTALSASPSPDTALPEPTVAEPVGPPPSPTVPLLDLVWPETRQNGCPSPEDESSKAPLRVARVAALMVFLCGVAHAPRYWTGLSQAVLEETLFYSGLCALLALALLVRAAPVRLPAATAALGVTAALAGGQVLGGRFGLPDPARLRAAGLAPPWLAGTAAAAAALTALAVLLVALTTANFQRGDGRQAAVAARTGRSTR